MVKIATWVRMALMTLMAVCGSAGAAPVTILDNGNPENRVDIVFLGDGYTQADLNGGIYDQHIQGYLNHMFSSPTLWDDPFPRYAKFFNAHKIDVVSNQSGADIPSQNVFVDTALNATYESFGIERLLTIDESRANSIRNQQLSSSGITADMQLVTVNHTKYGGSGGSWAVYAGGNSFAHEVALHELGHSFPNLSDEYESFTGPYPHPEPSQRNITTDPTGAKWSHWLGFADPRGSTLDIGVFEGAAFYPTGIYRPSSDSKMRNLNLPFDAVSREAFIHDIYTRVDPLDDWLDNSAPLSDVSLWVDAVDPDVIRTKWYVDDVLIEGATSESFNPADFGFGPGIYEVRAHAYDDAIDYAFSGTMRDLVRTRFDLLQQDISWTLTLTSAALEGDYNGDGTVDHMDIDQLAWAAQHEPTNLLYDLNGDGMVTFAVGSLNSPNPSDSDILIYDILQTRYGDADLNRQVFLPDLIALASNYRKAGQFGWAQGNFNGIQEAGTTTTPQVFLTDLIALATNWRFGVGSGASAGAAVPEPSSWLLALCGVFARLSGRRR